ncbi:MAG TPA: aminotransferase class IV [Acidimicrobiia bacterium]|nr:aminotransferase class IV [Acidimicrobiia bacterium]
MRVLIDGRPVTEADAFISVFDWGLVRGFGVFEVIKVYGSSPFRLDAHLDRLERSAAALGVKTPGMDEIERWIGTVAETNEGGHIRVILTGGGRDPLVETPPRSIVMWEPTPDVPQRLKVIPMAAPWHPETDAGGFPGVKWTSYAPNMAATDKARRAGFDEALLIGVDGMVLEGPTFTVGWVHNGNIETPSLDCGILPSITRDVMIECAERLGIPVKQGRFPLDRLLEADEAFAMSTLKELSPIAQVADHEIPVGPVTRKLAGCFREIVESETG